MKKICNMVCDINEIKNREKKLFGHKAYNISLLSNRGVKVPQGFAISSEIFDEILLFNKFAYKQDELLAKNREVQDFILQCKLMPELKEVLLKYLNLKFFCKDKKSFVVRSSALCEDTKNHSMAGVFKSVLNIHSYKDLEQSIKEIYSSVFSEKSLTLMIRNNLNIKDIKMGIIVQDFIEGSPSGVSFTADTVNMDDNVICINSVNGMCCDFVNGKLTSALYKIDKKTGDCISVEPKGISHLDDYNIMQLYKVNKEVEKLLEYYQDIEWTFINRELYILQARPITTYKFKEFPLSWKNKEDSQYMWFNLFEKPFPLLLQEIFEVEKNGFYDGAYLSAGQLMYYGDICLQNGYYFGNQIDRCIY